MRCLWVLSALVGMALVAAPAPVRAACTGDCDGNGAVTIEELIRLVDVALDGSAPTACAAGDVNGDARITIEELIAAVSSALLGCPATPTASAASSATSTVPGATPTPTAAPADTATSTVAPADTATATPSSEPSATAPPSHTRTPTRTGSPTSSPGASSTAAPTATVTQPVVSGTATVSATASRTGTRTATPSATHTPTRTPTASRTATPTRSLTPSATRTASVTPTPGLGVRRFSLDPQSSGLNLLPTLGTFQGFSGYLDLAAGAPDPVTGLAIVDIVGASEFLSVQVGDVRLCLKPIVPMPRAGVLACAGGVDLGVSSAQDHNIGEVGIGGFTAQDCAAAGGVVEAPGDPHPGVCNGPVDIVASAEDDSGAGALMIAPDARFATEGLVADVTVDEGDCAAHGPGDETVFGFVSGVSRATIADADNDAGAVFQHDAAGENFSCAQWMQENGPGRVVLSVPAVHGTITGDLITVFTLAD